MSLVLGIDPGTAVTGFGLVRRGNDASVSLVECGVIRTSARESLPVRIREIYDAVAAVIVRHAPDVVVVDAVGRITALRTGRAQIFTRWNALSIAPIGIEVVAGTVEALRFEGDVRTVAADEVLHMTVEGLVAGQWIDLTHAVSWISSDHQVLLAEDSGLVTGVARGRTSLTARYGPVAASVDIVVIP